MFDFINTYMHDKMGMKNLPKSNTMSWKIIVYLVLGIIIFFSLQTTRLIFTNSMVFVVCSIILTGLLIYFLERFVFGNSNKKDSFS